MRCTSDTSVRALSFDDRWRGSELAEESSRCRACDGAELGVEMRLVVVARSDGDARPGRASVVLGGAKGSMEAREFGVRLRAEAEGLPEDPTKVSLADTELCGDRSDARARQPARGVEGELHSVAAHIRHRQAAGDGAVQDRGRIGGGGGSGDPIGELPGRALAPQALERDHSACNLGRCRPEHGLVSTELKTRDHGPQSARNELSVRPLPHSHRMHVEAVSRGRPEANDEADLRPRDRNQRDVVGAFVQGERGNRRRCRHAREHAIGKKRTGEHGRSLVPRHIGRKLVRFFQSRPSSDR